MQEILIDGGKLVFQDSVQMLQDSGVAAHDYLPGEGKPATLAGRPQRPCKMAAGCSTRDGNSVMYRTFDGPAQQIPDKRDALAALRFGAERAIDHRNRAATAIGLRMKFPVGDAVAETDVHRGLDARFILFMYKGCEQFAIAIASSFVPRVELPQCEIGRAHV